MKKSDTVRKKSEKERNTKEYKIKMLNPNEHWTIRPRDRLEKELGKEMVENRTRTSGYKVPLHCRIS